MVTKCNILIVNCLFFNIYIYPYSLGKIVEKRFVCPEKYIKCPKIFIKCIYHILEKVV